IRRWFQFAILDLLIVTAIVGAVAALWRPVQAKTNKASPWVIGDWYGEEFSELALLPDGCFYYSLSPQGSALGDGPLWGFRWTMMPLGDAKQTFVLTCGKQRLLVRGEWGSG